MCVGVVFLSFAYKMRSFISVCGCQDNQIEMFVRLEGQLPHGLGFHVIYNIQACGCFFTPFVDTYNMWV